MRTNILFDLGHPGHFHLFKNAINHFRKDSNYRVFVTTRQNEMIIGLLESHGFEYFIIGKKRSGLIGKFFSVLECDVQMLFFVLKNKIGLGLHCGIVLSHISILTSMRSWIFDDDDDDVEPLMVRFSHPFSEVVFTPDCIKRKAKNTVYYPGTHELAYLYNSPKRSGMINENYSIVRLVAFRGHHDFGHSGLDDKQLDQLVSLLERSGKVYITSEKPLSQKWERYRITISSHLMHDFMSQAILVVGDSQTMISEAATMGVPAFKCNSFAGILSVPNMLEHEFGLCYAFSPSQFDEMIKTIDTLLKDEFRRNEIAKNRNVLLSKKLNTTALMIHCIQSREMYLNDFRRISSEEWLSLCSNFEYCD